MTFLNSLLNGLDDVDIQYQNEINLWTDLIFLKNFNTRICDCCKCKSCHCDDCDDCDECDEYEVICSKNDICNCQCKCIYPIGNLILNDDKIIQVLYYLNKKNVHGSASDLIYIKNKITNCSWNLSVMDIFNISDKDIKLCIEKDKLAYLKIVAMNFNVLQIMSGLSILKYSS
jgi:hypothetical protein